MEDKKKLVHFNLKLPFELRKYCKIKGETMNMNANDFIVECLKKYRKNNKINLQDEGE